MAGGAALDKEVRRVASRRAMARTVRQLSLGSMVCLLGLVSGLWPPGLAWLLGPLCLGCFVLESVNETARHLDVVGEYDGLIECAVDHRAGETPIILAQRLRALAGLQRQPISATAPWPHVVWWLPIIGLVIAVGLTVRPVPPPDAAGLRAHLPTGHSDTQSVSERGRAKAEMSVAEAKTRMNAKGSLNEDGERNHTSAEVLRAGVGRQTGKVGGGPSEGRMIPLDGTGRVKILSTKRKDSVNDLNTAANDSIAEPARPFPKKYHAVIENWFQRKDK